MLNAKKHKQAVEEASQWLIRLQSPALTSEEESDFFAWLEAAPEHQFAYVQAEKAWEMGGDSEALKMMLNIQGAKTAKKRKNTQPSNKAWFQIPMLQGTAFACACLLLVGLAVVFPIGQQYPDPYQVATSVGEQTTVTLDDGSTVFLNTDTTITVAYSNNQRLIILEKGEAFFDVQNDPKRAFDVEMNGGRVRVLGTQFTVHVEDDDAIVTVLEGKVGLDSSDNDNEAKKASDSKTTFEADATLQANQQLSLSSSAQKIAPKTVDAKAAMEWRSGRLVFKGDTLATVVSELNRYFDQAISIGDEQLASLQVIAVIHISDLNSAIQTLERSLDIRAEKSDSGKVTLLPAS